MGRNTAKIILILLLATSLNAVEKPYQFGSADSPELRVKKLNNSIQDLYNRKQETSVAVDNYSTQTIAGNKTLSGFTSLGSGNTGIKIKKLTGVTGGTEGDTTNIAHGLTGSKILNVLVKIEYAANSGLTVANHTIGATGYQFTWYHDATNVGVQLHATESENILSKPITVLVIYEE